MSTSTSQEVEPLEIDPDTPLGELYDRRVKNNQDLTILIEDWHARRGTGKTTLTLRLGEALDRTEEGLTIDKCSLAPQEIVDGYTDQPKGSALAMDEGSAGLSKYRAGSYINKAMRDIVTMGRIEEKYLILNAPAGAQVDSDLRILFDVVIFVQQLGEALVHFVKRNPYDEGRFLDDVQKIEWTPIEEDKLTGVYRKLSEEKKQKLRGGGENFYTEDEFNEKIEEVRKETEKETRDKYIKRLVNDANIRPADMEEAYDLTQQRIGQIARE